MPEFGLIKGMAVSTDMDQAVNDLFKFDEMNRRAQATSEAKAKLFAEDLEFQNAANSHDNPLIKEYAKNQIAKIGSFVRENPDWATNVGKRTQLNLLKRELKDNPELLRGVASDEAFRKLNADLAEVAKNPQQHDEGAYADLLQQRNNYLKYGNQNGLDALQKEGKKAFIYQKPRDFVNLPETLLKAGNSINPSLVIKGKNIGEYTRTADPNHVKAIKDSIWKENGRQIQVEAAKLGLNTPEAIDKWLTDGIMAGVKTTYDIGDVNAAFENGLALRRLKLDEAKAAGKAAPTNYITPWDDLTDPKKPSGYVPQDVALKVWGDTPQIKIAVNGGKEADLTGYKVNYDGRYITDGNKVRRIVANVDIPVEQAKKMGIYDDSALTEFEGKSVKDAGITSDYLGKAVVRVLPDGKQVVRVTATLPIDSKNGTMRELYNTHSGPAKLVQPLEQSDVSVGGNTQQQTQQTQSKTFPQGSQVDEAGNVFFKGKYIGKL